MSPLRGSWCAGWGLECCLVTWLDSAGVRGGPLRYLVYGVGICAEGRTKWLVDAVGADGVISASLGVWRGICGEFGGVGHRVLCPRCFRSPLQAWT